MLFDLPVFQTRIETASSAPSLTTISLGCCRAPKCTTSSIRLGVSFTWARNTDKSCVAPIKREPMRNGQCLAASSLTATQPTSGRSDARNSPTDLRRSRTEGRRRRTRRSIRSVGTESSSTPLNQAVQRMSAVLGAVGPPVVAHAAERFRLLPKMSAAVSYASRSQLGARRTETGSMGRRPFEPL